MAQAHIIAEFRTSPIVYGLNGSRSENPDYCAPIRLTASGKFQTEAGASIKESDVPAHIKERAKAFLADTARAKGQTLGKVEMTMADAMALSNKKDPAPEPVKRKRGRPRKVAA